MEKKYYELLQDVRENPVLYLGKASLQRLSFFISGYVKCSMDLKMDHNDYFFTGFQAFIQKKCNVTLTLHWSDIIDFYYYGGESAFYRFFEFLEEYFIQEKEALREMDKESSFWQEIPVIAYDESVIRQNLNQLLLRIYERPVVYLGEPSLKRLIHLIHGYEACVNNITDISDFSFYPKFDTFVKDREKITLRKRWWEIIDFYSASEAGAFALFYQWLKEFFDIEGIPSDLPAKEKRR